MQRISLIFLLGVLLLTAGCGSNVLFRADFKGVSNGPFATGSTGQHQEASKPDGDKVRGTHLLPDTVRFVNGVNPDDALALMLAPNLVTEPDNPIVEFLPVQASSNDDKRTFFWQGRKTGDLALDCDFRDWTSSTSSELVFTLRFANGHVFVLTSSSATLSVGNLTNGVAHNVFVTLKPGVAGGNVEISPHGGGATPLVLDGFYTGDTSPPEDVRVICSYNGNGLPSTNNYLFDRMVFRSK